MLIDSWGNPNKAYTISNFPVVVLCNAKDFRVLEGSKANLFKKQLQNLTNHFCGVSENAFARDLINSVEPCHHDLDIYNAIFNKFWKNKPAPEPSKELQKIRGTL